MSGLDTSQSITDEASLHAAELHVASHAKQAPLPGATDDQAPTDSAESAAGHTIAKEPSESN